MRLSRRKFLKASAAAAASTALPWRVRQADAAGTLPPTVPMTPGPFTPNWDSLTQYQCPEWFRDAKFGIWAHWSAQCVPEQGDWYARGMYQQHGADSWNSGDYAYQCAHYGHPSKVGFKDIDHIWHAENWDPEHLLDLYQKAGAKYFVALGNHHDNFDNWDSKYQPWNSVNIGPKKDIIGMWGKAARKRGMRFGVTLHANRTWDWFDVAHQSDTTGPLAGVPYDGHLTKADGMGQWWEGYDPAELYGPAGAARTPEARAAYELKFYNRVLDVLDQHQPDLLYFDDGQPPTAYGLDIVANYYNKSMEWHNGKLQAVLNVKDDSPRIKKAMVLDYERGSSDRINPHPWQTDTCIGSWHYQRSVFDNHTYKTPRQVVRMLVDIVSKNGNLLLNIPLRGDGTPDSDELAFLDGMAAWMAVNHDSIYATRPWKIPGEGPVKLGGGGFSEGGTDQLSETDFRFVTKGDILYATSFGWPESGTYTIKTLASGKPKIIGEIKTVELLGSTGKLAFTRTTDGLVVTLPARKPCDHAWALKIVGLDLAASDPTPPPPPLPDLPVIPADADGSVTLTASAATLRGSLHLQNGSEQNIGFWNNPTDTAMWRADFPAAGAYTATLRAATGDGPLVAKLTVDQGAGVTVAIPLVGDWDKFQPVTVSLSIPTAGSHVITMGSADEDSWMPVNLSSIKLVRSPK